MRVLLKSAKVIAVLLSLGWAAFAVYLGSISTTEEIVVDDGYVQLTVATAKSGAAFFEIRNRGDVDDRLISVSTDAARTAMLHTNFETSDGVMQMRHLQDGMAIPAKGSAEFARGGDHVMLMGLTRKLADGDDITLTLVFEQAGEKVVTLPVRIGR